MRTLIIIMLALALRCKIKPYIKAPEQPPPDEEQQQNSTDYCVDFLRVSKEIDDLYIIKQQLENVENMITELSICNPLERSTALYVHMPCNDKTISMICDNSSTTVIDMFNAERQRLRTSLVNKICVINDTLKEKRKKNDNIIIERGADPDVKRD